MTMNQPNDIPVQPAPISLDTIRQMKAEKLKEVRTSKERMTQQARSLLAPLKPQSGGNALMQNISSGIAIFDGLMTGIRIMRRIRRFFS